MAGGDDNRNFSLGFKAQLGGRSGATVWNAAYQSIQFWDGCAATLEDQAKGIRISRLRCLSFGREFLGARAANRNGVLSKVSDVPR